jgi:glutathione S-transferase
MYVLHHHPFSQHARRVVALLEEAGLAYELRHVAMDKGEHMSPDFMAINPNHQVPVLTDGELRLFESNAILRYLANKHGLTDWYPPEPARRAVVDQWLDWNQCRLSSAVIDIVFNKVFLGPKGDQAAIARGEARVAELTPILEIALQDSAFLAGDAPTIADISVASNLTQLGLAGSTPTTPAIRAWLDRVNALPGVQRANSGLPVPEPA